MPRYDDRYGNARLYVGHLGARTRSRDLEDLFSRYGRVRDVDMKRDYAFVEFSDYRDADDARHSLNGREFDGSRIIVEFSRGGPRGAGGSREYSGRGAPPGSGRCFNCGLDGHWARDCKAGDWKNKCYRCGDRGHIERNCQNSPKNLKRGRSYSRSPTPRRGGRSRSLSYSRSRSYSLSRSPPRRDERRRSRSLQYSRSPEPRGSPAEMKDKKRSPTPLDRSPSQDRASLSPRGRDRRHAADRNGSDDSGSPRENGMTPASPERRESSPNGVGYGNEAAYGRSPTNDQSDDDNRGSPRGSRSPSNP